MRQHSNAYLSLSFTLEYHGYLHIRSAPPPPPERAASAKETGGRQKRAEPHTPRAMHTASGDG